MRALLPIVALATLLGGCATTNGLQEQARRDPYEKFNRKVYAFNKGLDNAVFKPVTIGYRTVTPLPARRGITSFFQNVKEPLNFINALLQGKPKEAVQTLGRFGVNSVLGVGGLRDHATDMGLPVQEEDFGQTLAVWGVKSGPYLMLPLIGPSTLRDTVGFGVDMVSDPYSFALDEANVHGSQRWAERGLEILDLRSFLMDTADVLLRGSADEYATVRTAYLLARESLITDGASDTDEDAPMPTVALPADSEDMPPAAPAPAGEAAPSTPEVAPEVAPAPATAPAPVSPPPAP